MNATNEPLNPTQLLAEKRQERNNISDYLRNKNRYIMTSRFSNATWNENRSFMTTKPKLGCVYCSPSQLGKNVPIDGVLFVLEMNNDKNRIMGIGMVVNHPQMRKYSVYQNNNYNRYVFSGKHRIDRDDMSEKEEQIMKAFDILCFKGHYHMKRGQGLLSYPPIMLYRASNVIDLVDFINNMFKNRNLFKMKQEI